MPVKYTPWLRTDVGRPLAILDGHFGFSYSKLLNGVGHFSIIIPLEQHIDNDVVRFPVDYLERDRQMLFLRTDPTTSQTRFADFLGFLRRWKFATDRAGNEVIVLSGPCKNHLLKRRIVDYTSQTPQSQTSTNFVDDSILDLIAENMGASATDTARDLTSAGLTIRGDQSRGPNIQRAFSWRELARIISDLNQASRYGGTEVFWDFVISGINADNTIGLEFATFVGAPGGDRSWKPTQLGKTMVFGTRWGNLISPTLEFDYSDEVTAVTVAGQNQGVNRSQQRAADDNRINASVWNRIEKFVDARNQPDANLLEIAEQELERGRGRVRFNGQIISTEQTPYGDWGLGSLVTVEHKTYSFNALVRNVTVSVDANENENVSARIEYESAL